MRVLADGSAAKSFELGRPESDTSRPDMDHRRRGTIHQLPGGTAGAPGGGAAGPAGAAPRRQIALRQLGSGRRQRAARPPSVSSAGGGGGVGGGGALSPHQIQLISLPQLDLVQRSLKVLDVRVQRLHAVALEEDKVCVLYATTYAQFIPHARHDKTVLAGSCQAVRIESRDRLAKSEQSADRSPSSRGV